MIRSKWFGVIGGVTIFLVIVVIFFYTHSNFDSNLIEKVEAGVPPQNLIPEIEAQSKKQESKVKSHLEAHVMDMRYWSGVNSDPQNDLEYHVSLYQKQMEVITGYKDLRIQFVRGQINKKEFLDKSRYLKGQLDKFEI